MKRPKASIIEVALLVAVTLITVQLTMITMIVSAMLEVLR